MNDVDLNRWATSPKLRALSLASRGAWLLLRLCGYPVVLSDFVRAAAITPITAGAVLAELIAAGLVEMEGPPAQNPTMLALPAFDESMAVPHEFPAVAADAVLH